MAIAAYLSQGQPLEAAVRNAKESSASHPPARLFNSVGAMVPSITCGLSPIPKTRSAHPMRSHLLSDSTAHAPESRQTDRRDRDLLCTSAFPFQDSKHTDPETPSRRIR